MTVLISLHSDDGFLISVFDNTNWIVVATTPSLSLAEQIKKVLTCSTNLPHKTTPAN